MAKNKAGLPSAPKKRKRDSGTDTSTGTQSRPKRAKRSKLAEEVSEQPIQNEHGCIYHPQPEFLEVETLERYRPGGLHPVVLDEFIDGAERFRVLHKLGHGDSSTTWLCHDARDGILVAVKILSADASTEENAELKISALFSDRSWEELQDNHISLPREHFWIKGPNGRHLCTVSELLAANSCIPPPGVGPHDPYDLNELCFQVCKGLRYLHANGVCHGDIRKHNLAMEVDLNDLNEPDIYEYLGEPSTWDLQTITGKPPGPWGPKYLVAAASTRGLASRFGTGRLKIIDFGLAYICSRPPKKTRFYRPNAAPELLFGKGYQGMATDIWALGCLMCQIVRGRWIFDEFDKYPDIIRKFESYFGPFPTQFRRGARDLLIEYGESPRRTKSKIFQHQPSVTRSGRSYQASGLVKLASNVEGFKLDLRDYEKKTGWSHRLQGYLSYRQQFYRYWERLDEPVSEGDEGDSMSENGSDGSNKSQGGSETDSQFPFSKLKLASRRSSRATDESPPQPKRLIKSDLGTWPDPSSPCTCYQRDADGYLYSTTLICQAQDHYIYDPEKTTIFALTREEVISFSDLLLKVFTYSPTERIDIGDILNHEWFAEVKEWDDQHRDESDTGDEMAGLEE